jgi:predicted Fe-S protein YdhL (DUF1289 family)
MIPKSGYRFSDEIMLKQEVPMPISSPCNKVCTIDPRSHLCLGCGRTLTEIAQWASLPETERIRIMAGLPDRMGGASGEARRA